MEGHTTWFRNFWPNKKFPGPKKDRATANMAQGEQEEAKGGGGGSDAEDDSAAYCFAISDEATKAGTNTWGMDSRCSHHMTGDRSLLRNVRAAAPLGVTVADKGKLVARECGEAVLLVRNPAGKQREIQLTNVHYVPGLAMSLISVSRMADKGVYFNTEQEGGVCVNDKSKVIFRCVRKNGIYCVESETTFANDMPDGVA
jgi:hypothetical protein